MIRVGFSYCSTKITKSRSANQLLSFKNHVQLNTTSNALLRFSAKKPMVSRVRRSLAKSGLLSADIIAVLIGFVKCNFFRKVDEDGIPNHDNLVKKCWTERTVAKLGLNRLRRVV